MKFRHRSVLAPALAALTVLVALLISNRRQRRRFGFPVRPMWAEVLIGVVGCVFVLGSCRSHLPRIWSLRAPPVSVPCIDATTNPHNITDPYSHIMKYGNPKAARTKLWTDLVGVLRLSARLDGESIRKTEAMRAALDDKKPS